MALLHMLHGRQLPVLALRRLIHCRSRAPVLRDRKEHYNLLKREEEEGGGQLREAWLVLAPVLVWYIRRRLAGACSLPNPLLLVRKQHGQLTVYYCFIFFCKLLVISSYAIIMLPTNFKPWACRFFARRCLGRCPRCHCEIGRCKRCG
jgi:hypothetical protein